MLFYPQAKTTSTVNATGASGSEERRELQLMRLYYQRRDAAQKTPDLLVTHEELEQQLVEKIQAIAQVDGLCDEAMGRSVDEGATP